MKRLYLLRYGEIALKGQNRYKFEDRLVTNIQNTLKKMDNNLDFKVYKTHGRIFAETDSDDKKIISHLQKVIGLKGIAPALEVDLDIEQTKEAVLKLVLERHQSMRSEPVSFKIDASRANKNYKYDSMELNDILGGYVEEQLPDDAIEVDVHNPDIKVNVEVRSQQIYVYTQDFPGPGGLPVGSTGKVGALLSGGIDSPVASWMAMKRGTEILPIYFHTFPFTTDRAKEKVIDIAKILSRYQPGLQLYIVNFTPLQKELNQNCPESLLTLIMRRYMLLISKKITEQQDGKALVTGGSLGQVASQTLESMVVTNQITGQMPIFRPLIGLDKEEIIQRAKDLDFYDISIRPYDDCCSVFTPDHPEIRPQLKEIQEAEKNLNLTNLVDEAVESVEVLEV